MIIKHQKEQTVVRLKKAYSTLSQTTQRAIADNGPISTWSFGEGDDAETTKAFVNKYMVPYLNVMKKPETLEEGNWNNSRRNLNGGNADYDARMVRFYLSDGTSVTCHINPNTDEEKRLIINIDINGDKKPNISGKDIFQVLYYLVSSTPTLNGKFIPTGYEYTREELLNTSGACNRQGLKAGNRCMALIMKDGWRIADDYPW